MKTGQGFLFAVLLNCCFWGFLPLKGECFAIQPGHRQAETRSAKYSIPCGELRRTLGEFMKTCHSIDYARISPDGTSIECLWGKLSQPLRDASALSIKTFLDRHAALFNISQNPGEGYLKLATSQSLGKTLHQARIMETFERRGYSLATPNSFSGAQIHTLVRFDKIHRE